jgi:hypothetical protein
MEYVIGIAAGAAFFFFMRYRKPTTNDLTTLIIKHNRQKEGVTKRGKGLFS